MNSMVIIANKTLLFLGSGTLKLINNDNTVKFLREIFKVLII